MYSRWENSLWEIEFPLVNLFNEKFIASVNQKGEFVLTFLSRQIHHNTLNNQQLFPRPPQEIFERSDGRGKFATMGNIGL